MKIIRVLLLLNLFCSGILHAAEQDTLLPLSSMEQTSFLLSGMTGIAVINTSSEVLSARQQYDFYNKVSTVGETLSTQNLRASYLTESQAGRVYNKAKLIEQLGDDGARRYAQKLNFTPLYQGEVGQGRGFDHVYQSGKQVIVLEAKGGGSPLKRYHGYLQGTKEYALEVAKNTLNSNNASANAKNAAAKVIEAARENRLVYQVSRTQHVQGMPTETSVETKFGNPNIASPTQILNKLSMQAGLAGGVLSGGFDLLAQLSSDQPLDLGRTAAMTALGTASAGVGTYATSKFEILASNQSKMASVVRVGGSGFTGGMLASAVFAYGSYFLGYSDLQGANRQFAAGAVGGLAGSAASAGVMWAVMSYGTASTGTAIASLSGAAATNAALASLGGGTLASGGLGVAGGATVLTGGAALVVIGVASGVMYLYHLGDEKTETKRVAHLIASVQNSLR